ncbi:hypothetical protein CC80DRAFT_551715 [Byssothecium circinans]|uniref:Uncharacterized protein n=1 Tax=Byssothecium circinans TaxID=147558 RepID=A0A6A5TKU7_9PLEO|nr:hypothetical protein CC80DRAFT_551715 [Byssothecium circinans]
MGLFSWQSSSPLDPFIVLVYVFVVWGQDAESESDLMSGYATVETWACAVAKDGDGIGNTGSLCTELRTARYLLISALVPSVITLGLVIQRRIMVGERELPALVFRAIMLSLVLRKQITKGRERTFIKKSSTDRIGEA